MNYEEKYNNLVNEVSLLIKCKQNTIAYRKTSTSNREPVVTTVKDILASQDEEVLRYLVTIIDFAKNQLK